MQHSWQEPGSPARASLVELAHSSSLPIQAWVSCAMLWLSPSDHGVMQILLPSSARGLLFIFINIINHLLVIHSCWEPKGLTLTPALASPSVTCGGTEIKNASEPGRCSQASRMQEKAGTSYFGQLGMESLKNSLGLSMCFQNSKSMCYTIHPSFIFHFYHHHKEVIN